MQDLRVLAAHEWPQLYRLMVSRAFPGVPPRYEDATPYFAQVQAYGLHRGHELVAAFVFGPPEDGVGFLDVVCAPRMQGRWATAGVLRALYGLAFDDHGLRAVWVQPHNGRALKACLQAGFVFAGEAMQAMQTAEPVLVMTRAGVPRRFQVAMPGAMMTREGERDGKSVQ